MSSQNSSKNGYPKNVIENCVKSVLDQKHTVSELVANVPKCRLVLKLHFCGNMSVKLKQRLIRLIESTFHCAELRVVFKSGFSIAQMFHFKDRVPSLLRSHVVYKLNCEGCNAFYIGKTTAHVSFRIKNEISGKENSGALEHMMECGQEHYFVVKNTQV